MSIAHRLDMIAAAVTGLLIDERRARCYDRRSQELCDKLRRVQQAITAEAESVACLEAHPVPRAARAGLSVVTPDTAA